MEHIEDIEQHIKLLEDRLGILENEKLTILNQIKHLNSKIIANNRQNEQENMVKFSSTEKINIFMITQIIMSNH